MTHYHKEGKNINLCAPRAYYVPFSNGQEKSYNREDSQRFVSLNGIWKIQEYDTVYDAEEFYKNTPEKEIPVPSCVQLHGYDIPQYTNQNFPFAFNPPYVTNENPTYHYRKTIRKNHWYSYKLNYIKCPLNIIGIR